MQRPSLCDQVNENAPGQNIDRHAPGCIVQHRSLQTHRLLYPCDALLLNMDELNLHKRAAGATLPTACSPPVFHNRTRAAQLLIAAGTVLPAGCSLRQCETPRLEGGRAVCTKQSGCCTTGVHENTLHQIKQQQKKTKYASFQSHQSLMFPQGVASLLSWLIDGQ